jgi:hypothetical protein
MFGLGPATKIYIGVEAVDMRKGFDGLNGLVRDQLGADPSACDSSTSRPDQRRFQYRPLHVAPQKSNMMWNQYAADCCIDHTLWARQCLC